MSREILVIYSDPQAVIPYRDALLAADLEPRLTPVGSGVSGQAYGGLLLMGGADVDPAFYGEARQPETEDADPGRDEYESAILREALGRDLPVLAICRGLQLLNVALGGTLVQHLQPVERHRVRTADRGAPAHAVVVEPDSLLSTVTGERTLAVNSRHHQAVKALGRSLRVCGRDPEDGTVEAVEHPGHRFVLAVQWHPEDQVMRDAVQLRIFQSFGAAVKQ